jgi:phosphoenolpyruvate synthase
VSRELGVPAVVGTGNATEILKDGRNITLSCAEGDQGYIYEGILEFEEKKIDLEAVPETRTKIMMIVASPAGAFRWWRLPCEGIGLARMEFIINNIIKIHPMALVHFDKVEDSEARKKIEALTRGYEDKTEYFVDQLAQGIGKIGASQYPHQVIVRMSDFKTNEYAELIGGRGFEPEEENPMLGFRGASRYYSDRYREGFALECRAIKRVREEIGMENVIIMIPFCRTLDEADRVLEVLAENGLKRGENGLEIYVMCEIPSNVLLAEAVFGALRRVFHREQRSHPARFGCGPGFRGALRAFRRTQRGGQENDPGPYSCRASLRPESRHLRAGAERSSRFRGLSGEGGDRLHLPQPGQRHSGQKSCGGDRTGDRRQSNPGPLDL